MQVDDELQLVHRLEVGELGLVAGLDERLEGHLHEGRSAAAQDRLLAEQVGLGLLRERRLEDAGAGAAERPGIGEDARRGRVPDGVAMDGEQGRHAAARPGRRSRRRWPGPFGATIPTSIVPRRVDPPEVDVEAVGEHQQLAGPEVRRDLRVVDRLLGRVRDEDHDHVAPRGRRRRRRRRAARPPRRAAGSSSPARARRRRRRPIRAGSGRGRGPASRSR